MTDRKAQLARQFIEAIPHSRSLGMRLTRVGAGEAEIEMDWDARFVGDPRTGVIAGGAVSALMDTCGGAAVMSHPRAPAGTATIDLRIDYMRPATTGQTVRARAVCYHITRSVAFVRATAFDDDADRPVASATGAFTVEQVRGAAPDSMAPDSMAPDSAAPDSAAPDSAAPDNVAAGATSPAAPRGDAP